MIERLRLRNFRGIKNGDVALAPLTILVGPNNSAKTSVLESLFLIPNPIRKVPFGDLTALSVLNRLHASLNSQGYTFLLRNYSSESCSVQASIGNETYDLGIGLKEGEIVFSTMRALRKKVIHKKESSNHYYGFSDVGSDSVTEVDAQTLIMGDSLFISSDLMGLAASYLELNWASLINSGITRNVARIASRFSREKYSDLTIEPFLSGRNALYAFLDDGRRIRIGDLGEGIQGYILSRAICEVVKPSTILWDDVESHLNPRMLHGLASWFGELLDQKKQIVVTTHSLEATRILAGVNEEKASILMTSLEDGELKTKTLTVSQVADFSNAGIDVRTSESALL